MGPKKLYCLPLLFKKYWIKAKPGEKNQQVSVNELQGKDTGYGFLPSQPPPSFNMMAVLFS